MASSTRLAIALNSCLLLTGAAATIAWQHAKSDEAVARPTGGGGSVVLEPAPARHEPARSRAIFVCRKAAPVIFSDRPCGEIFEERRLRIPAAEPAAGGVATMLRPPAPAATRPKPEPEPEAKHAKPTAAELRCRSLRDEREKLDDRMRTGYSAREAAKLWNRWRELNAEIYAARC